MQNSYDYLNLSFSSVHGGKKAEVPWKLKYLEMSQSAGLLEVPERVLQNCHFLQKLAVDYLILDSCEIEQICQNGETLRILSLQGCTIDLEHRTELIKKLFTKCSQLTELNIHKAIGTSTVFDNNILLDRHDETVIGSSINTNYKFRVRTIQ